MVVKDIRNLSENEKQKLDEYIKTYYEMQKKKKCYKQRLTDILKYSRQIQNKALTSLCKCKKS